MKCTNCKMQSARSSANNLRLICSRERLPWPEICVHVALLVIRKIPSCHGTKHSSWSAVRAKQRSLEVEVPIRHQSWTRPAHSGNRLDLAAHLRVGVVQSLHLPNIGMVMEYYDCVSQHAVDHFLEPLRSELNRARIHKSQTIHCTNNRGPEKKTSALSVILTHCWALKVIAKWSGQSVFKISRCICHRIASCPCYCCHDPFIVRSSNLSTIHWFHSACTSVSMFTINVDTICFCALVFSS